MVIWEIIDTNQALRSLTLDSIGIEWLASDHIHLYINAAPDYALDDIVHALMEYVEQAIASLLPELQHSNQSLLERAYFAEGIG